MKVIGMKRRWNRKCSNENLCIRLTNKSERYVIMSVRQYSEGNLDEMDSRELENDRNFDCH